MKLAVDKTYMYGMPGDHAAQPARITDIHGEQNQFIGYRYDDQIGVRWLTAEEFKDQFVPLSSLSLTERCDIMSLTIAKLNHTIDTCEDLDHHFIDELKEIIADCTKELQQ